MGIPYRWVIVFLGGLMGCVAIGAMFSLAVFLDPMAAETGWSRAGISTAMTLDFLIMGIAGFFWGTLSDRWGPRPVVLIGAVLLGAGLVVASRATSVCSVGTVSWRIWQLLRAIDGAKRWTMSPPPGPGPR